MHHRLSVTDPVPVTQVGSTVGFQPCSLGTAARCTTHSAMDYEVTQVDGKTVRDSDRQTFRLGEVNQVP